MIASTGRIISSTGLLWYNGDYYNFQGEQAMLHFLIFALIIFLAYFVPYFFLGPESHLLAFAGFWTVNTCAAIILALIIMGKWREER